MPSKWFLHVVYFHLCWTVVTFHDVAAISGVSNDTVNRYKDFDVCEVVNKSGVEVDGYLKFKLDKKVSSKENELLFQNQHVTELWTAHCEMSAPEESKCGENPLERCAQEINNVGITSSNITGFSKDYFCYFSNLKYLNLADNELEDFTQLGLNLSHDCSNSNSSCRHQLEDVNLSGNPLRFIRNNFFCQLSQLRKLNLNKCLLTSIESDAFLPLAKLSSLGLSGNLLKTLPHFPPSNNYLYIDLSSNRITSLSEFDFINITALETLNLSRNYIGNIEDETFKHFVKIVELDLSNNQLRKLNASLVMSAIRILILNDNYITEISSDSLAPKMEELYLRGNLITSLQSLDFISRNSEKDYKIMLEVIDLSHNKIDRLDQLWLPNSVVTINVSNNNIDYVSFNDDYSRRLTEESSASLQQFDLQNNNFSFIPVMTYFYYRNGINYPFYLFDGNALKCSCENVLFLRGYLAANVIFKTPCTPVTEFKTNLLVPNLTTLSLSQLCESNYLKSNRCLTYHDLNRDPTDCDFNCPKHCHCYTNFDFSIVHLYCSNNQFQSVPRDFDSSKLEKQSEIIMWLDGNNFTSLNSNHFINYTDLDQLYLNNSNIYDIDRLTFGKLTLLKVLNLCDNHLYQIQSRLFDNLIHLQELYLNNNNLIDLSDDIFANLKSLKILHLHENELSKFREWNLKDIPNLKELTLRENKWSCECNSILEFRDYLKYYSLIVHNVSSLICTDKALTIIELDDSLCATMYEVIVSSTVVSVSVVLLLSVSLLFRYRREMQVLIYSRLKVRLFNRSGVNDTEGKLYDAFMAYSSDDLDFVVDKLLPNLEAIERPYRVCIHERDFLAGGVIAENIMAAVGHSARTLIVLTESFVRSGWCRFEFKAAHMQMLQDKCPRVLLIVVDDIPEDADPEMKLYLNTYTYLKWGEKLFWQKLYYAMPDLRVAETYNQPFPEFVTTI